MNSHEKNTSPEIDQNQEVAKELLELGEKQQEKLREDHERSVETKSAEKEDDLVHEAREKAASHEVLKPSEENRETSPAERRNGSIKKQGEENFKATMHEVQSQMSAPSRTFSKLIHNKAVEKVSEVAGNTVARPDAILSGAVFAFILTLGAYLVAKNIGYPLSGFETIGAFALGWVLGLIYDFLKVMITGRK